MQWFDHLHQSPFCAKRFPILIDATGRDVCLCGWKSKVAHSPSVGIHAPGVRVQPRRPSR